MATEEQFITLDNKKSDLGKIKVAPNVIEVITSIATTDVDGVNKMRGNFSSSVQGLFGRKERSHGVKLVFNDDDNNLHTSLIVLFERALCWSELSASESIYFCKMILEINNKYCFLGKIENINKGDSWANITVILEDGNKQNIKMEPTIIDNYEMNLVYYFETICKEREGKPYLWLIS